MRKLAMWLSRRRAFQAEGTLITKVPCQSLPAGFGVLCGFFFFPLIFIFGCAGSSLLCTGFLSCRGKQLLCSCPASASHSHENEILILSGSRAQAQKLWSLGPEPCGIFLEEGLNLCVLCTAKQIHYHWTTNEVPAVLRGL